MKFAENKAVETSSDLQEIPVKSKEIDVSKKNIVSEIEETSKKKTESV